MFNLHVVQARYGDCLILEYATADAPRYMLIDGGPRGVYEDDLRPVLQEIAGRGNSLEIVVLSHIDDDHVTGLLDLLAEIQQQRDSGVPGFISIGEIWHNTFSQTLGADVEERFQSFMDAVAPLRTAMYVTDRAVRDIAKGDHLTQVAGALGIPLNKQFDPGYLVSLAPVHEPVKRENLTLWIVAPNQTNLLNLREDWLAWLEEHEERVAGLGMEEAERAAIRADTSVPNLSSIMFLAVADGKSVLLTGDGRGDHLLDGLEQAGLLDPDGRLHVDVLKLPHHGSRHNISKEFLQAVTADRYVISASGRYRHPSQQTLEWIAEVAREQGRTVEIILTNHTSAVDHLLEDYDPAEYGYSLTEMAEDEHALVLELGNTEEASALQALARWSAALSSLERRIMMGTLGQRIGEILAKITSLFSRDGGPKKTQPKWTFMVYLAGDNNLSDAADRDLVEMTAVGSTADVNIVAELDCMDENRNSKRYYVKKGELEEVVDLGETDSGDPNNLLSFIAWAKEHYPADRYALILWNHGGGWDKSSIDTISQEVGTRNYGRAEGAQRSSSQLGRAFFSTTIKTIMALDAAADRAICSDDGSGHSLDTIELGRVLAEAKELLGQKIDLLGMDACLMSNLEVAYQAREYVSYTVASEDNEPNNGWPYTPVLQKLVADPDIPTADFGAHIVDAYIQSYAHTGETVTQAAMDLSKAEEMARALDELADALVAHQPASTSEMWHAARPPVAKFWNDTLWDISHFCERLELKTTDDGVKAAARRVLEALAKGNFVVNQSHQGEKVERCGGVTLYLPMYEVSRYYAELDFAKDHRWEQALGVYHKSS